MFPQNDEITSRNTQIERLNLDVYTLSLWLEVEWVNCQKLLFKLKRIKRELVPNNRVITHICADVELLQESMGTLCRLYERELAQLSLPSTSDFNRFDPPNFWCSLRVTLTCPNTSMSSWEQFISCKYPSMLYTAWNYPSNRFMNEMLL